MMRASRKHRQTPALAPLQRRHVARRERGPVAQLHGLVHHRVLGPRGLRDASTRARGSPAARRGARRACGRRLSLGASEGAALCEVAQQAARTRPRPLAATPRPLHASPAMRPRCAPTRTGQPREWILKDPGRARSAAWERLTRHWAAREGQGTRKWISWVGSTSGGPAWSFRVDVLFSL